MAKIKPAALNHELKRWMRPDWRRYWRPGHEDDPLYKRCERIERKYSPDQPRVPAGVPEGGQWTDEDGGGGSTGGGTNKSPTTASGKPRQQTASRISPEREEQCELQYRQDKFKCSTVQSPACYNQAMLRYANCRAGLPIPPLVW